MWLYFLERENEKVVITSHQPLLDATRETQEELEKFNIRYKLTYTYIEDIEYAKLRWRRGGYEPVGVDWLAEAVAGWHCTLKDKPTTQPLMKYEDIFKDRRKKKKRKRKQRDRQTSTKPLPHQRWAWNKSHIIEGTIEMIVEEALRQGLIFELIFSEYGREFAHYYGEAFKDLVRKKIRE